MEAVTAPEQGTGSKTMADLAGLAAEKHADKPALRHKSGDDWVETTYAELGEAISEVGARAHRPGDRARREGLDRQPHPAR